MEFLRRIFSSGIESDSPETGDFLERLRLQRKQTEETVAREAERERLEAIAEQKRETARQNALERERLEELKNRALRIQALVNSIVPELMDELGSLIGREVEKYDGDSYHIQLDDNPVRDTGHKAWYRAIIATGIEDGSVRIGSVVLKSEDAKVLPKVDAALEKAYRQPALLLVSYASDNTPSDTW